MIKFCFKHSFYLTTVKDKYNKFNFIKFKHYSGTVKKGCILLQRCLNEIDQRNKKTIYSP